MLGSILGAIAGKPQYHADANAGWEPFPNSATSGDCELADWSEVARQAHNRGYQVSNDEERVVFWRNKNDNCWFLTNKGGVKLARQFLEGIR